MFLLFLSIGENHPHTTAQSRGNTIPLSDHALKLVRILLRVCMTLKKESEIRGGHTRFSPTLAITFNHRSSGVLNTFCIVAATLSFTKPAVNLGGERVRDLLSRVRGEEGGEPGGDEGGDVAMGAEAFVEGEPTLTLRARAFA